MGFWGNAKPAPGTPVNLGHWLAAGLRLAIPFSEGDGAPSDVVLARHPVTNGSPAWGGSRYGTAARQTTTAQWWNFGDHGVIPTQRVTVAVLRQKTDATLRNCSLFGTSTHGVGENDIRCGAHVPFSDGTVYWDFGDNDLNGRLSVAGLTFTREPEAWVFVAGSRGMSIWRDGKQVATKTTHQVRNNRPGFTWLVGAGNNVLTSDLQAIALVLVLDAEWGEQEVKAWTAEPYDMFAAPAWRRYFTTPAAIAGRPSRLALLGVA